MGGAGTQGPIEFTFSYTEEEYVSAARAFLWRRRDPKFERTLMAVFGAVLVLIFVLAGDPYLGGFMLTFMLAVLAVGYFAYRLQPRMALRREPKSRGPFRVRFAEEGIRIDSKEFDTKYNWGYFPKLLETAEFFFFAYTDELYFPVPKRALRDRGEEAALRELLRRKFGERMETHGLPAAGSPEIEHEYVPPPEPPDWR